MLEFVQELHFRSAINLTAWCGAIEANLAHRGYILTGKDVVRRKFAMAMKWHTYMVSQVDLVVDQYIDEAGFDDIPSRPGEHQANDNDADDDNENENDNDNDNDDEGYEPPHEDDGSRFHAKLPSAYLQTRCPLCFPPVRPQARLK
jgi:hypothetical protein